MATAELGANGVPEQLHQLDAVLCTIPVRATDIFIKIWTEFGILEVDGTGVEVDHAARQGLFDEVLNDGVEGRSKHLVSRGCLHIGQNGPIRPRLSVTRHRLCQAPEQVAIGNDFPNASLHAAVILRAGRFNGLEHESCDKLKLDGQASASLQERSWQEAGLGEKVVGPFDVAADEHILPWDERVVEHKYGIVLVEATRQGIVERASHDGRGILV